MWSSGFLPTAYQGVEFLRSAVPIPNLASPKGVSMKRQGAKLAAIQDLNRMHEQEYGDPEIATRIASYEMAFRMQTSGPELMDLSSESQATLDLYGVTPGEPSYATNCLLARRMIERGVRFVQLYHTGWDHHGNLSERIDEVSLETDRPSAALITDLKQRGLLEDTLVIWGGEFGRTPMAEFRESVGRNHHIDNFPMWFAGGGIKPGQTIGEVDDLGFFVTRDKVEVHDVQATILHLLGIDHTKLTYRYQGPRLPPHRRRRPRDREAPGLSRNASRNSTPGLIALAVSVLLGLAIHAGAAMAVESPRAEALSGPSKGNNSPGRRNGPVPSPRQTRFPKQELDGLAGGFTGRIGFYAKSLATGAEYAWNGGPALSSGQRDQVAGHDRTLPAGGNRVSGSGCHSASTPEHLDSRQRRPQAPGRNRRPLHARVLPADDGAQRQHGHRPGDAQGGAGDGQPAPEGTGARQHPGKHGSGTMALRDRGHG